MGYIVGACIPFSCRLHLIMIQRSLLCTGLRAPLSSDTNLKRGLRRAVDPPTLQSETVFQVSHLALWYYADAIGRGNVQKLLA